MIMIYGRQSIDKKDSISIETQIDFCLRQVPDETPYRIYKDKGYSGSNVKRPDFERMMQDMKSGSFTKLIVYRVDRISRSLLDFADIVDSMTKNKIEFCSATETFDTSTAIGRAMLNIIMVFAQLEREQLQIRVTDNYYARGRKGFYLGGVPPYGFSKIPAHTEEGFKTSKLVPNEKMGNYLTILELWLNNYSLTQIAKHLNGQGIPAAEGGPWDSSKISKLLHNPAFVKADAEVYAYYEKKGVQIENDISEFIGQRGCYLYGKRPGNERKYANMKDHKLSLALHEGIIDPGRWLRAQKRLDSKIQVGNAGKGKHSWLSGIIKCGYCGYSLVVVKTQKKDKNRALLGKDYKKFYCSGHRLYHHCHSTVGKNVDQIEEAIRVQIFDRINEMQNTVCNLEEEDSVAVNKIKLDLLEVEKQVNHIVGQICNGGEALTELLNCRVEELMEKKRDLESAMEKAVNEIKSGYCDDLKKCIRNWDISTIEQKKVIVQAMIEKVTIKDESIDIIWKI